MRPYQEPKTCGECRELLTKVDTWRAVDGMAKEQVFFTCSQSLEDANPADRACPLFEPKEQE